MKSGTARLHPKNGRDAPARKRARSRRKAETRKEATPEKPRHVFPWYIGATRVSIASYQLRHAPLQSIQAGMQWVSRLYQRHRLVPRQNAQTKLPRTAPTRCGVRIHAV